MKLRQLLCGLRGHDALLHFEFGRVSMKCHSCGWESAGWTIGQPADAQPKVVSILNWRTALRSASRKVA